MKNLGETLWGLAFLAVILTAVVLLVVHWQWSLIVGVGGLLALGLVKFGWDASGAASRRARD